MRLKRWESPRKEGRNEKGRGNSKSKGRCYGKDLRKLTNQTITITKII